METSDGTVNITDYFRNVLLLLSFQSILEGVINHIMNLSCILVSRKYRKIFYV